MIDPIQTDNDDADIAQAITDQNLRIADALLEGDDFLAKLTRVSPQIAGDQA